MPTDEVARSLVTRDGTRLAYWLRPARLRPPARPRRALVLLHGMASNHTRWSEFCAFTRLGENWDLLRLDLRGHGDSLVRSRTGMPVWCNDLAEILAREAIGQALLVGHCLGANLALHFAHQNPTLVGGLVLIEPMLPQARSGALAWASRLRPLLRAVVPGLLGLAALGLHRRRLAALDLVALDREARQALAATGEFPEARFASSCEDLKSLPLVIYLQDLIAVTGPLPELATIAAPTLVLLAGGSRFGALEAARHALAAMPRATIQFLAAKHWIPTEQPEALRLAIEDWCKPLESAWESAAQA